MPCMYNRLRAFKAANFLKMLSPGFDMRSDKAGYPTLTSGVLMIANVGCESHLCFAEEL